MEKKIVNVIISIKEEVVDLVEATIKEEELDDDEQQRRENSRGPAGMPMKTTVSDHLKQLNNTMKQENTEPSTTADVGSQDNCDLNKAIYGTVIQGPLEHSGTTIQDMEQGLSYTKNNQNEHKIVESGREFVEIISKPGVHQCLFCFKVFPHSSLLAAHEPVHQGQKAYKCSICEKIFNSLFYLKYHEIAHSGKSQYKCNHCQQIFFNISTLRIHEHTHKDERPYTCNHCQKTYSQFSALRIHELTHTGKRPYKCTYCQKTYFFTRTLRIHESTHTGERPYKCNTCEKTFSRSGNLRRHERVHTNVT